MDFYYVSYDLLGSPFNSEFPPDFKLYGNSHRGYANDNRAVLFNDFAIEHYDVQFRFNDKWYYLLFDKDHAARCDENFNEEFEVFRDPNTLIKNLVIDGHRLIDVIDELEDIAPM